MPFEHLFSPIQIGSMTLRNRIIFPPHEVTFMSGYGDNADRVAAYFAERAKGGVAMIVMSALVVPPSWRKLGSWNGEFTLSPLGALHEVSDDDSLPAYRKVIEGVHGHGAKFLAQLNAGGRQHAGPGAANFGLPFVAPSAIPCPKTRQIPKALEVAEIQEYIDAYVHAALNMQQAGADGVEVFAAQGYLVHEFLSPASNWRTDDYGGSLENRMRFLMEIIHAIRKAVGREFVVGVRMNGSDYSPNGIDLPMAREMAEALKATGLVDYLNVSGMTYLQFPAWIADMTSPDAMFADLSQSIRAAVPGTPVCVVTRIGSPELAESLIAEGKADLVGMVRALIADPELPNKAKAGDLADIRGCTYSNHCVMSLQTGRGLSCLHNVAVGKEAHLGVGILRKAARRKQVVIVGGGPAGLAAARVAAERGHAVTLVEKGARLGGQNLMTAAIATRKKFGEVTRWQKHRLERLNVSIRLGVEATCETVSELKPDVVVLATGSYPLKTGYSSTRPDILVIPGVDRPNVFTVWDVFDPAKTLGSKIMVVDDDPHYSGVYAAEHLADTGHRVEIVTPQLYPARDQDISFVGALYARLGRKGIRIRTDLILAEIGDHSVRLIDRYTGEESTTTAVDSVVLAMGNQVNDTLYRDLKDTVGELYTVGDCVTPRRIDDAILDGERVGWMI